MWYVLCNRLMMERKSSYNEYVMAEDYDVMN